MNKTRHYIRTLLLVLLLLAGGGTGNEVWAKKVTYHILTKPFTVRNYNNTNDHHSYIRVEALQCTSEESTVGLPDQFKSPLATGFRYWKKVKSEGLSYNYLYDYTHNDKIVSSKYYIYQCTADNKFACLDEEITEPETTSTDADRFPDDIYVTYDYINDVKAPGWKNNLLELNGETDYNVTVNISNDQRFMCFNRSRNNRVANALASALSGEQLVDVNFVVPDNTNKKLGWAWGSWGPVGIHLGFEFLGNDPYNITIMTSYKGDEVHVSDAITGVDVTPYSSTNQNKATIKPYKGATLFGKIGNTSMWFDASNDRHYKVLSGCGQNDWKDGNKYEDCKVRYYALNEEYRYDTWMGFYRNETPTMNSYALLPNTTNGGYLFVGSKMNQGDKNSTEPTIYQPNKSGQYALYNDNNNNPYFKFQALSSAYKTNLYEIRSYTLYLKTHGSKQTLPKITIKWSDAMASDKIVDHIPEALKRKYCNYKAYSDEALANEITSFTDAINNAKDVDGQLIPAKLEDGKNIIIWLDYTVTESFPFETLPEGDSYVNARWYTMRMDGVTNPKYIAYNDDSNKLIVTNGSGNPKGSNTASQIHQGENSSEAMVAFMGDPYELRILSRKACEDARANQFVGCADNSEPNTGLSTNITSSSGISKWEIVYESIGEAGFLVRQFNTATSSNPKYIGLGSEANNKPVTFSEKESRIRVVELEKVIYTYHIVLNNHSDNDGVIDGDIAVKASSSHDVGKMLSSWEDIPEIIRSSLHIPTTPTATYYESINDAKNKINAITSAPYDSKRDIYVRYSFAPKPTAGTFNVILNGEYLYTSDVAVSSKGTITGDEAVNANYQWEMDYSDPYDMTIQNKGNGKYVKFSSWSDNTPITWVDNKGDASRFVVKKRAYARTYEVMAATGDYIDASVTYYNIGRPSGNSLGDNPVRLYSNSSYLSGNATLLFQFISTTAMDVTYHLIDKAGKDLLQAKTRQASDDKPTFPPEFHSPLVKAYHYYVESNFDKTGTGAGTTYTLKESQTEATTVIADIYVTYDVNDLVNLKAGQLYLLKYEAGEEFYQEDGSNGLTETPIKAIYPYVNGDGNFFVYGEHEYQLQQMAASTRTRWVWYVQSDLGTEGDPYHVTIRSFQTETYPITNYSDYNAYFMTYKPEGYTEVVTTLAWPGMADETATEYMVLGSEGQYQLVTTYPIPVDKNGDNDTADEGENVRYTVNSFEQYWKTYDTVKNILLKDLLKVPDCDEKELTDRTDGSIEVPTVPASLRERLTKEKADGGLYEFHSYAKWAYAKRWNGYNNGYSSSTGTPEKKKGWETREHWYQTIDMGQGYFDFVKASIDPVLILLDQHGWEIMRMPLPTSPDDPLKDAKYEAIRAYNSPMVKEYKFYSDYTKATGYHKYIPKTPITVDGKQYVSTSLTSLPPYETAVNVKDKKGNLNDQYVTYTVKDEYAKSYSCSYSEGVATETVKPFLIQQGDYFASVSGDDIVRTDVPDGGMNKYIMDYYDLLTESGSKKNELWYIRPNRDIDLEMGMSYSEGTDTTKKEPWTRDVTETYYNIHHLNGFDPYNIQIQSVSSGTKYLVTNADEANVVDGAMEATYPAATPTISLDTQKDVGGIGNDHNTLHMTNATFMVVQDKNGNMQLMPRFDHSTRMSEFGTLIAPTDADVAKTYTKLYRPVVYDYRIIDNDGHESLRYKSGGDMLPQTPDHFKSPLAKDYAYYKNLTKTEDVYTEIRDNSDISEKLIEESLDGAEPIDNIVYVRYKYDEDADRFNILKGNWMTMQLNNMTTQYTTVSSTAGIYSSLPHSYSMTATDETDMDQQVKKLTEVGDYYFKIGADTYKKVTVMAAYDGTTDATYSVDNSSTDYSTEWNNSKPLIVNADGKKWQWKFFTTSQSKPDPYAIYIYNRSQSQGTKAIDKRFAILSHTSGDYALAEAGLGTTINYDYTYNFLNGASMSTTEAATTAIESGFKSATCSFSGTYSQVKFIDDVEHFFTYKVYTNGGVMAIMAYQTQEEVQDNDWATRIPADIKTPLLNLNQFRYYGKDDYERIVAEKPDTIGKSLSHLYGLYDDEVVVRYIPYEASVSEYQVPNVRNATGGIVAKGIGSNDAALDLSKKMIYNIIWYNDNMMFTTSGTDVAGHANQELQQTAAYEWQIDGNDPYAMTLYNKGADRYITAASAADNAACTLTTSNGTTFMLLPKNNYEYGMLAITGNKDSKLTIPDNGTAANDDAKITTGDPAKFIIFALATHRVIYHLMIKNIDENIIVPYKDAEKTNGELKNYKIGTGSTLRDLKSRDTTGDTPGQTSQHIDGDLYQLGGSLKSIVTGKTDGLFARDSIYCHDAGKVSLGDKLEVPSVFYRPNVKYFYIIEGVYDDSGNEITDLNNKYKGVMTENMGDDEGLLQKTVFVNIVYRFDADLGTNSGSGFVTNVSQNKWYSFDTNDATPQLAQYTGTSLQTKSGYATHYTNDYLWTPVGDPYGFKMYNRYACKNLGQTNLVMTTASIENNVDVTMGAEGDNGNKDIYELIANSTTTPGYFRVHPMMNIKGVQYYMNSSSTGALKLSITPTEWRFGLSEEMLKPYYEAAGYVGGLNVAGKAAYETEAKKTDPATRLMAIQDVVYNHDEEHIVPYAPGYYRLHNQPGSMGISTPRYASGYTHKTELTGDNDLTNSAIPMHFYEVPEYDINNPEFIDLDDGTFTKSHATRGNIPLSTVISDPASIFYFYDGLAASPTTKIKTQELYVKEDKMTANESDATSFSIVDIGGGVVALYNGSNYLSYKQTDKIYDLKYGAYADESARWCMQPVQKKEKAGDGEMGLMVKTNNGDDGYYYASFYAPFDALLTDENDVAYLVPTVVWPTTTPAMIHPKKIGKYNTEGNSCPEKYRDSNRFIPAGTPVIIRTTTPVGYVTMALPSTTPSTPVTTALTGKYLEQKLDDSSNEIYGFGRSLGTYKKASDFVSSGLFESISPNAASTDIGFFVNANPNKELSESKVNWTRNNKYVYANKIYYLYAPSGSRELTRSPEFIPVVFDDDEDEPIEESLKERPYDHRVYDMRGRCVATEDMVENGTWRHRLAPGIYILNGRKIIVK